MHLSAMLKKHKLILISIALFLIILPLSLSIDFVQNDEHTRYNLVRNFMHGDFSLDPYISTTFYIQGFLGAIFASLFGLQALPVFTLIISTITFYYLVLTLQKTDNSSFYKSVLLGVLLFFNPIFFYSTLGFMTEIYFLVFLVVTFYFIQKYLRDGSVKELMLINMIVFLSYLVRQVAVVSSVALLLTLVCSRKYRHALLQAVLTFLLLAFHLAIFPQTDQMLSTQITSVHMTDHIFLLSLIAVILIYLAAFFAPVVIVSLTKMKKLRFWFFVVGLSSVFYLFIQNSFDPLHLVFTYINKSGNLVYFNSSGVFPYLKNIFGREGFFVDDFEGTKYYFRGFFTIFKYWGISAAVLVPALIAILLHGKRNYFLIYLIIYGGFLVVMPKIYDRYLLYMFPALLLQLAPLVPNSRKLLNAVFVPFIVFLIALNYQYSMDFIKVQSYVWNKSNSLVTEKHALPHEIKAGNSWNILYPNNDRSWKYVFSYDDIDKPQYSLMEQYEINFPFSLYINSKIRLYKLN